MITEESFLIREFVVVVVFTDAMNDPGNFIKQLHINTKGITIKFITLGSFQTLSLPGLHFYANDNAKAVKYRHF